MTTLDYSRLIIELWHCRRSTAALRNLSPTSMVAAAEAFTASQMNNSCPDVRKTSPEQLLHLVSRLESKLNTETVEKSNLEGQIAALREENQRLQEESQSNAQQLRRFTEWFFQTMENNQDDWIAKEQLDVFHGLERLHSLKHLSCSRWLNSQRTLSSPTT